MSTTTTVNQVSSPYAIYENETKIACIPYEVLRVASQFVYKDYTKQLLMGIHLKVENNEITSDELVGQIDSNIIQLNGNVNLISDQYSLYSDSIQFDHFANTGCFYNANIEFDRLLINASKISKSKNILEN